MEDKIDDKAEEKAEAADKNKMLIDAFHLMWDTFPGAARLIDKGHRVLASNKAARKQGLLEGQICARMGAPESHKGCLKAAALRSGEGRADRPAENKVRGWLPLECYEDVVVHFSLPLPAVND